jgi:hypothetical protein
VEPERLLFYLSNRYDFNVQHLDSKARSLLWGTFATASLRLDKGIKGKTEKPKMIQKTVFIKRNTASERKAIIGKQH